MKNKFVKSIEYLFLFLLICQVGGLIFFNLSDIRCSLDLDAASAIYHYMEVIKNRTLRLPDWNHTTTLELDGSFMLAVPIYFLIKNIFLSIGIANIIMACLYLFVVYRILYHANIKKTYI